MNEAVCIAWVANLNWWIAAYLLIGFTFILVCRTKDGPFHPSKNRGVFLDLFGQVMLMLLWPAFTIAALFVAVSQIKRNLNVPRHPKS